MKKLILTSFAAVAMLAAANNSNAQGTVNFSSSSGGSCITSNTTSGATAKITAGNFAFGLYVGSSAATISTTPVLTITNSGFAGIISGSTFTVGALSTGSTYFFEVKGWTAAAGTTYESALTSSLTGTAVGVSSIGQFTAGGGSTPAGNLFGTSGTTVSVPVLLTPVPEPSTMVLGGLGIAILSTSSGLLTDKQAQAKGVGGEVLAYVW